jgi:hypothetical protein
MHTSSIGNVRTRLLTAARTGVEKEVIRPRNGPLSNCARLSHGRPRYLLRDRDKIFGPDFVKQVKAMAHGEKYSCSAAVVFE